MLTRLEKYSNYHKNGDLSATNFTGSKYQLKLALEKREQTEDGHSVQAMLGSGLHLLAEKANDTLCNVLIEQRACRPLLELDISGTIDFMIYDGKEWKIYDYKVKGAYSAKKFIGGETFNEMIQLSINRWIRQNMLNNISRIGYIECYVAGDINAKDKAIITERAFLKDLELMSYVETEVFMQSAIKEAKKLEEPDCEKWRCNFCSYVCKHRKDG